MANNQLLQRVSVCPPLPTTVTTRGGVTFDPRGDIWTYKEAAKNISVNFNLLPPCAEELVLGLKLCLLWFAQNKSGWYTENSFQRVLHFMRSVGLAASVPLKKVSVADVLNYRATLDGSTEWYLRHLSIVMKKWHALGYPGVEADVVSLFKQLKVKSNARGVAVLTQDPQHGPFTDIELESIQAALDMAFSRNEVPLDDYLLAWLFMLLGARPVQFACMKVCDFSVATSKDGSIEYCLRVPRAKQRHGKPRLEFKERLVTPQIGEVLNNHVETIRTQFADHLSDPGQAPMFPATSRGDGVAGFEWHLTSQRLSVKLVNTFARLQAYSERTGAPLNITATRFRRTLGTRAAAEGHGELIIAELLDHSDTSNAGVYVQSTPAIVNRIDKAVALQLAPLAQAFAGVLIRSESEAVRGNDPASRILDPRIDASMKPMGSCGKHGFCGAFAPIACYTCTNFQPWLDGPHEAVLNHLISERERMLESTDNRIASVNDRTILAVAEVVRRCAAQAGAAAGGKRG